MTSLVPAGFPTGSLSGLTAVASGVSSLGGASASVTGNANRAAAEVSVGNQLANVTWTGRADNRMAVQDVYVNINGQAIINSIQSLFNDLGISGTIADLIRGGEFIAATVGAVEGLIQEGEAIMSEAEMLARILTASPQIALSISGAGFDIDVGVSASGAPTFTNAQMNSLSDYAVQSVTGEVNQNIVGAAGADQQPQPTPSAATQVNGVVATINGVGSLVKATDLTDIYAVGQLMNKVSGNTSLFTVNDKDAQVGFIAGMINTSLKLGVPNAVEALAGNLADPALKMQVVAKVLPTIVEKQDADSLEAVGKMLGDKATLALYPNVIPDFTSHFTRPVTPEIFMQQNPKASDTSIKQALSCPPTPTNVVSLATQMREALTAVDSDWEADTRGAPGSTTPVLSVKTLLGASSDFQQILIAGAKVSNAKLAVTTAPPTAPTYDMTPVLEALAKQDVVSQLQMDFPMTVYKANNISTTGLVPPDRIA